MTQAQSTVANPHRSARPAVRFGQHRIPLPHSRTARIGLGIALLAGGMLFFLPVLGLWMLPLGLLVLSVDFLRIRRIRRRLTIWWGRRSANHNKKGPGGEPGPKALGNGGVSSREDARKVTP